MKRVAFSAFVAFALFFLQLPVISSAAEPVREKVDANIPMVATLNLCKSTTQLDCIESVVIISGDGKRLPARQTSPASEFEEDENKQRVESGESTWEYTTSSGVTNLFLLSATLATPTYVAAGSIDEVGVVSPSESTTVAESETATEKVNIDTRSFDPKLSITGFFYEGDQSFPSKKLLDAELLEVVVRTSWLQIEETFLPGKKSAINIDSIAGGKKITLTGSEVIQVMRRSCTIEETVEADKAAATSKVCLTGGIKFYTIEREDFEFLILHPKKDQESCQEKGFKVTSTNASSFSLSDQNRSNSIQFNISGYGFRIDGSVNPGFAIIRMPLSWISCRFPNSDLPIADTFNVKVNSTDGSTKPQNASAKAILAGTLLEVTVENFTFAQTEIVIEASAEHIVAKKKQASEEKAAADKAAADKAAADKAAADKAAADKAAADKAAADKLIVDAKAAADLKAKQEAEAKAAAELKAKQEAEAKAAAELKAKQEAELEAAAEKLIADVKAAADAKAVSEKIIQDAKLEAERILAAAQAAATKKTTITCTKGKLIKKVTAVKPKCPVGYKVKK